MLLMFVLGQADFDLKLAPANTHYVSQRAPLAQTTLQKLPIGAVTANGWLKLQLDREVEGFSGKLSNISRFLDPRNNAWMGTGVSERAGWEELPYWLRGQVALGYVTKNDAIIKETKAWIEGVLKSQTKNGWFGPKANLETKLGTPDLWPNMLMQYALQTYFEATHDNRVITLLTNYNEFLSKLPDAQLIDPKHYWQYHRVADQLACTLWLYNITGNQNLLSLANRLHNRSSNWVKGIPNEHGVNFAQGFREPAIFSVFSKNTSDFQASVHVLDTFRKQNGDFPGGMYAADENARKGMNDPRQACESCAVAEMMLSDEQLMLLSGDTKWADDAENVTFNWLPVTMTPDLKALRYLQSPNLAISDGGSKSPGVENGGPMFLMDPNDHRCCQHNVGMAWPYFTQHLWTATNGNGVAALMYAPCTITAKVANSTTLTIKETTDYPFDSTVNFSISVNKQSKFPISFRIPGWCKNPKLTINGRSQKINSNLVSINQTWKTGDKVKLELPMEAKIVQRTTPNNTLSVERGPLWYSLKIGEKYIQQSRPNGWNASEIHPTTSWNYGLEPGAKLKVTQTKLKPNSQPFETTNVPIKITTKGRKIPNWTLDMYGLVAQIQSCPALTTEKLEDIELIPMGAARLRITVFPTVTQNQNGNVWKLSPQPKPTIPTVFSFRNWFDSEKAPSDGLLPTGPNDQMVPRFTWWDHKGTDEWIRYNFNEERVFTKCRVFWFDDKPEGGCRLPESWKLQVRDDDEWVDVNLTENETQEKGWSTIQFKPIRGKQFKLSVKLQKNFSAGILEWELLP